MTGKTEAGGWAPGKLLIPAEAPRRVALSPRMAEVQDLMAEGLTNSEVAWRMGISKGMVAQYTRQVFRRLGVSRREEVIVKVWRARAKVLEQRMLDLAALEREFAVRAIHTYRAKVQDNALWLELGVLAAQVDDPLRALGDDHWRQESRPKEEA